MNAVKSGELNLSKHISSFFCEYFHKLSWQSENLFLMLVSESHCDTQMF